MVTITTRCLWMLYINEKNHKQKEKKCPHQLQINLTKEDRNKECITFSNIKYIEPLAGKYNKGVVDDWT